jgi:hypothetical protein
MPEVMHRTIPVLKARKDLEEDAEGLQTEVLLAEGARVMDDLHSGFGEQGE